MRANGKSTSRFQPGLGGLLVSLPLLLGCASSPSGDNQGDSKAPPVDFKSASVNGSSTTWIATLDHGDNPGNGYELIVRDGAITSGKFYLLDPNKPHDLKSAGQTAAFEDLKTDGRKITFSITLKAGDGKYHETMTLALDGPLIGKPGTKMTAKAQSHERNSASQELKFVRLE